MTLWELYLVTTHEARVEVYNEKEQEVFTGLLDRCPAQHLDRVVKDIVATEANNLAITVI